MSSAGRFEDLEIWQRSRALVARIYSVTRQEPFAKDFALCNQLRRSAISVPSNVAEGFERGGNSEFIQFLAVAKGSAGEMKTQLYLALDIGYLSASEFAGLEKEIDGVARMIGKLMSYLQRTDMRGSKYRQAKSRDRTAG